MSSTLYLFAVRSKSTHFPSKACIVSVPSPDDEKPLIFLVSTESPKLLCFFLEERLISEWI